MNKKEQLINLINQIDETRNQLYKLFEDKKWDLSDTEIVRLNNLLDKLLLEYYNIRDEF